MKTVDEMRQMVEEYLESNSLDMMDEFGNEEIVELIMAVLTQAAFSERVPKVLDVAIMDDNAIIVGEVCDEDAKYLVRITDIQHCVSFSDCDSTGVSSVSVAPILKRDWDEYDIAELISMVNEAWYLLKD